MSKLFKELSKEVRNHNYERADSGILFAKQGLIIGGVFETAVNGEDVREDHNLVVNTGLDYFLDVALSGGSQLSTLYLTAYQNNVAPAASWTAANFDSTADEIAVTDVDEASRPTWDEAGVASQVIDNYASKAALTVAVATLDLWGVALLSTNTFGGTSGTLIAAAQFSAIRNMLVDDVLSIGYKFTATSA